MLARPNTMMRLIILVRPKTMMKLTKLVRPKTMTRLYREDQEYDEIKFLRSKTDENDYVGETKGYDEIILVRPKTRMRLCCQEQRL